MRNNSLSRNGCAGALLSLAALASTAGAVELGDLQVRSFIGQPLVADIELVSIAPDEASSLRVRLASNDVYRGANIAMDPALQTLNLSVMRRDQRQFLHITSIKPVDASHAVLFLELSAAGRSVVREATAWLAPDPHPPAPLPPPAAPVPDSPALIAALARAEMERIKPAAHAVAPAVVHAPPVPVHAAPPAPAVHAPPVENKADLELTRELTRKNAALSKKLGELEGKLKELQQQVGVHPKESGKVEEAAAPLPKPKPLPLKLKAPLPKLKALPQKKTEPEGSGPWPWIAGAVVVALLAGLGWWLMARRKQPRPPSKYWVLLKKPFKRKKKAEEAKPGIVVMGPAEEAIPE
jgi:pilus assembly protein FimV